jgi:hypothetical protein
VTVRRHHRGRNAFVFILVACWVVGLFGLDGSGRASSVSLTLLAGGALGVYRLVDVIRRRRARVGQRRTPAPRAEPRTCIVVRFGEDALALRRWTRSDEASHTAN